MPFKLLVPGVAHGGPQLSAAPNIAPPPPLVCVQVIRAVAEYLIPRLCGFDEVLMNTMNPILPP